MGNFNFGSFAKDTTVSSSSYLRPYNVYDNVKFEGVEGPTEGTSASGNSWKRWELIFSCPEGTYKESVFEPNEKSTERRTITNSNGHESTLPSDFERIMELLKYIGATFNPEGLAKLQKISSQISSFEQFIDYFKKTIGTPDTTTKMKLGGRTNDGKIYASLPNFLAINSKTGEIFIRDPFFGDTVALSAWELSKKKEYESATPTDMSKTEKKESNNASGTTSQDVDDLLNSI